jgi:multisubunit Na+/H+ antiporter MnhF subunit
MSRRGRRPRLSPGEGLDAALDRVRTGGPLARAILRRSGIRASRRQRLDRATLALAATALAATGAAAAGEVAHIWRRGSAPLPTETDHVLAAAGEAAKETVEVTVEGYRAAPVREAALLNMLLSFVLTFGFVRLSTTTIHRRGRFGPFRDVHVGGRHVHHFVPGIVLAFLSGGAAIATRGKEIDRLLAIPFGAGAALTLDEAALLLQLEDVYWTEEGVLSIQVTLATASLLGTIATARRLLRRGEQAVLQSDVAGPDEAPPLSAVVTPLRAERR